MCREIPELWVVPERIRKGYEARSNTDKKIG